jgi:hypothetical protein
VRIKAGVPCPHRNPVRLPGGAERCDDCCAAYRPAGSETWHEYATAMRVSDAIEKAIRAHASSTREGYGEPIDHAINELCTSLGPGDFTRMASRCANNLGLPWQDITRLAVIHGAAERVMTAETTRAMNHCCSPIDTLRLMLAALDQAGLSVAGQREVVGLLRELAA